MIIHETFQEIQLLHTGGIFWMILYNNERCCINYIYIHVFFSYIGLIFSISFTEKLLARYRTQNFEFIFFIFISC